MPPRERPPPEDRDPNRINAHLKLKFSNVIGEPYAAQSLDICWSFYELGYTCCHDFVYGFLTLLSAPCMAIYWGCQFGTLAFYHIWICSPLYQILKLIMKEIFGKCLRIFCMCCLRPCTRACAPLFRVFKTEGVDYDALDNPPILQPVRKFAIPAVAAPSTSQVAPEPKIYLGERQQIQKSISRQMMLY